MAMTNGRLPARPGATIENMVATIEDAEVAGRTSVSVKDGALRLRISDEIAFGGADLATVFDGPPKTINKSGSLHGAGISSVDEANGTILRVDDGLDDINSFRGRLGAIRNWFESTINNLANSIENLSASSGRIRDADFAAEASRLAHGLVLGQASIAVLTQASQRSQLILRLLQ